jgi:predicted methyltransferase
MRRLDVPRLAPLLALVACATSGGAQGVHAAQPAPTPSEQWAALVADPERPAPDRVLDPGRKPALLAFSGVRGGMRVAELGAGGGYTTELLTRAVGPSGTVYSGAIQRTPATGTRRPTRLASAGGRATAPRCGS